MVSAPDMPVAQAATVQATPAMAEAAGGGGGSGTPGIDEDLQVSSEQRGLKGERRGKGGGGAV